MFHCLGAGTYPSALLEDFYDSTPGCGTVLLEQLQQGPARFDMCSVGVIASRQPQGDAVGDGRACVDARAHYSEPYTMTAKFLKNAEQRQKSPDHPPVTWRARPGWSAAPACLPATI
jgi:hypothetical protein